jgi:cytochrome c553
MRRLKKILKWTGITILFLVLVLTVVVAVRQHLEFEAPYPDIKASADSAVIFRGKELVYGAAACVDCHGAGNADSLSRLGIYTPLSGGRAIDLPFGTLNVKNITTDGETGIGKLTDAEIARTIQYGVKSDGTVALMPQHNFTKEDLTAIVSYLRYQKPVRHKVPDVYYNVMGKVIKAFLITPPDYTSMVEQKVKRDTSAAYGEYICTNVADCRGCHTEGDVGGETGIPFAGGSPMGDPGFPQLTPPNLTQHPEGRIYKWSQEAFLKRFRMGKAIPYSHMPWESFKHLSDDDLKAIYNFLTSLKPAKNVPKK